MAPLPGPAAPRLLLLPAAPPASPPPAPPRKRQRLAHLSAEEKALRRKLKNRVAAQSARDRKKARMGELERQAVELEAQNQELLAENRALRERTLSLAAENRELRLRLALPAPPETPKAASASWDGGGEQEEEQQQLEEEEAGARSAGEEVEVEVGLGPATGSAESAAGTGPAVAPPRAPLHPLVDAEGRPGSESDLLLGILDSLDPDLFLHYGSPEPAHLEPVQQQQEEEEQQCAGEAGPLPASVGFPLGPSLPKLEAINELIRFDHEYTKPFLLQVPPEGASPPSTLGRVEHEIPFRAEAVLLGGPPLSVKEEPIDVLLPALGISHLLSSDHTRQSPPMDASSDSGYEGSPSPFSDLASPLGTDYVWDEAFANELFPQLISV